MRLINADTYKTNIMSWKMDCIGHDDYESASVIDDCMCELDAMPAVDAAPVVHGQWINPYMNRYGHPCHCCSVCGFKASYQDKNYCPNCGAKMDGGTK